MVGLTDSITFHSYVRIGGGGITADTNENTFFVNTVLRGSVLDYAVSIDCIASSNSLLHLIQRKQLFSSLF